MGVLKAIRDNGGYMTVEYAPYQKTPTTVVFDVWNLPPTNTQELKSGKSEGQTEKSRFRKCPSSLTANESNVHSVAKTPCTDTCVFHTGHWAPPEETFMECAEDTTAGESLSELGLLKGKALEFLCKRGQEGRDAARGKQVLMLRAYLGHGHCLSVDCLIWIGIAEAGLGFLHGAQNQAFGCGVFASSQPKYKSSG